MFLVICWEEWNWVPCLLGLADGTEVHFSQQFAGQNGIGFHFCQQVCCVLVIHSTPAPNSDKPPCHVYVRCQPCQTEMYIMSDIYTPISHDVVHVQHYNCHIIVHTHHSKGDHKTYLTHARNGQRLNGDSEILATS